MPQERGRQHRNRTTVFPADKTVRATLVLYPEDEERKLYEELVTTMGVSGAQVLREALKELHKRETRRKARAAARTTKTPQELPKAG
ncbi:hypothetical protein [Streptomyces sp. BRA346]|uniref:hypothetical protein n=1 Tax=Streptomyces sp. BRA346 TaxID=2878199 RepID=UPI0040638817